MHAQLTFIHAISQILHVLDLLKSRSFRAQLHDFFPQLLEYILTTRQNPPQDRKKTSCGVAASQKNVKKFILDCFGAVAVFCKLG
jgi:hypothetical protein